MWRALIILALGAASITAAELPRPDDPAHLTPADRQAMLAIVRRAAGGENVAFDPETMPAKLARGTGRPLLVSAHRAGQEPLVAAAAEGTLFEQLTAAARELRKGGKLGDAAAVRLKIDVILHIRPAAYQQVGGLGNVGVHVRTPEAEFWLPPSEGLRLGLRRGGGLVRHALERLERKPRTLDELLVERFTTDSFIERAPGGGGAPVELYRGMPLVHRVTRRRLLAAIEAAGDWLLRFQKPDGSFHYIYNAATDEVGKGYNIVRHAGVAWSLVLAHRATGERRFLAGARRALDWLLAHARVRGDMAWIEDGGQRPLGAAALAVVALLDYRDAAATEQLDAHLLRLARFLLFMQREDGFFEVEYDPEGHRGYWPEGGIELFAPGEALLALVRLAAAWPKEGWRAAAAKGADFAVTGRDAWFAERELRAVQPDAWTMMALDELHALGAARRRHADYCFFLARIALDEQVQPGGSAWLDHVGAPRAVIEAPQVSPAAARCEGLLAAWRLARRMGVATERYRAAVELSVRFQLRHQYDAVNSYLLPRPSRARGGFCESYASPTIRIDAVQHNLAALWGAARMLAAEEGR